jgi:hypothetical protein
MRIKQTVSRFLASILLVGAVAVVVSPVTYAQGSDRGCGTNTAIIACPSNNDPNAEEYERTGLWSVLILAINILSGLAALAALGGIIYGSVLYTSAGGSQEQVKKAMGVFTNVGIGIIAFAAMYVLLNFLIPGGAF